MGVTITSWLYADASNLSMAAKAVGTTMAATTAASAACSSTGLDLSGPSKSQCELKGLSRRRPNLLAVQDSFNSFLQCSFGQHGGNHHLHITDRMTRGRPSTEAFQHALKPVASAAAPHNIQASGVFAGSSVMGNTSSSSVRNGRGWQRCPSAVAGDLEVVEEETKSSEIALLPFRIGHGFDLHRLEPGFPLIIGGVNIPHDRGCDAHSDGDVLLHCLVDAILGALSLPDIGQLFPDNDPKWKGADSKVFMKEAVRRMHEAGYCVGNVDATVILQRPKLSPHKLAILKNLCELLEVGKGAVNLKAKTHEKVDSLGENRSVACHAVILLMRKE